VAQSDDLPNSGARFERGLDDAEQRAIDDGGRAAGLSDDQRVFGLAYE